MPVNPNPVAPAFNHSFRGANLTLSEDGRTATRLAGTREAVVIGCAPMERQIRGLYFEVKVIETRDGWMGGLGIGFTHTVPGESQRVPSQAWRFPNTFVAGYTGLLNLGGHEQPVEWRPDELIAGQR